MQCTEHMNSDEEGLFVFPAGRWQEKTTPPPSLSMHCVQTAPVRVVPVFVQQTSADLNTDP